MKIFNWNSKSRKHLLLKDIRVIIPLQVYTKNSRNVFIPIKKIGNNIAGDIINI